MPTPKKKSAVLLLLLLQLPFRVFQFLLYKLGARENLAGRKNQISISIASQPASQPTSTLLIQGGIDQFNIILNLQSNHQRDCCRVETKARKSSKAIKADSNQNIKNGKRENKFRQNFGSFTDKQLCCFSSQLFTANQILPGTILLFYAKSWTV